MKYIFSLFASIMFLGTLNAQSFISDSRKLLHHDLNLKHHLINNQLEKKASLLKKETLDSCIFQVYLNSSGSWIRFAKEAFEYDEKKQMTNYYYSELDTINNQMIPMTKTEQKYDANDNLILVSEYEYEDNHFILTWEMEYIFTNSGLIQEEITSNFNSGVLIYQSKAVYAYDTNGNLESISYYSKYELSGSWQFDWKEEIPVSSGEQVSEVLINDKDVNADGIINSLDWSKTNFEYDTAGNLIQVTSSSWSTELNDWKVNTKNEMTYTSNGSLKTDKSYQLNQENEFVLYVDDEWSFDSNGNIIEYIFREKDQDSDEWYMDKSVYEYDLTALSSDYIIPHSSYVFYWGFQDNAFSNKLTGISYFNEVNDAIPEFIGPLYYSGDINITSSTTSVKHSNYRFSQKSKNVKFYWDDNLTNLNLELFTISGTKILDQKIENQQTISLESLPDGLYVYRLTNHGILESGKILLK